MITIKESSTANNGEPSASDFEHYFPDGIIETVDATEIPEASMKYFLRKKVAYNALSATEAVNDGFEHMYKIVYPDGNMTFVATCHVTYSTNGQTEEVAYLTDNMPNGTIFGWAELRRNLTDESNFFKNKPFVGYIETELQHRRNGYGLRRLRLMNAISRMQFHLPLYSDVNSTGSAKGMWEELCRGGTAEKFDEGGNDRYVFK